ncbi:S9 family peptidase [Pedobacter alpinus]|uniref:S9 family peptidase n=1 Tax=Pedobacter alpinus TaxID=1590643 RepID=A0ABW5TSJ9_9SPHI
MRKIILLSSFTFCALLTFGQKAPLNHSVYDEWQNVANKQISIQAKWVGYSVTPQAGDANLFVKNPKTTAIAFNYPRVENFSFTKDEEFLAFLIKPSYADVRKAKIKKKKPDEMPKDSLGILNFGSKNLQKIANVKSFALPENNSNVLVYLLDKELADTTKAKKPNKKTDSDYFFADEEAKPAASKEGTVLVLKYLKSNNDVTFKGVTDYLLSKNGAYLLYNATAVKKDSATKAGVFIFEIATKKTTNLTSGKGIYKNFVFDEEANQLAFVGNKSAEKALVKPFDLYLYNFKTDSANVVVTKNTAGMPLENTVSENGKVFFSKNGNRLFFGTAPIPVAKDTTIVDFEVAKVDIWNYQDDYLQPMQLANLSRKLKESYLAMVDLKSGKFTQIATEELNNVDLPEDANGDFALISSDYGNRVSMQWEGSTLRSAYIYNLATGNKTLINKDARANYRFSPKGNYVAWFDRKEQNWYTYSNLTSKKVKLLQAKGISFGDEENDVPDDASDYSYAGFTEDEKQILIYDRYDIWAYNPETGLGKNLTNGYGRTNQITFRYIHLDKEKKAIKLKGDILLTAFNNVNKQNGFYSHSLSKIGNPIKIVMDDYSFSTPIKAKDINQYIYEKDNYKESANVYFSSDFKSEEKLSDINLQQSNYNWGTAELVNWTTPKGYKATGVLYKPEDFDPNKKYPMLVYFYEKVSDNLFNYQAPAPTPSRLNISYFVSNGYLVFTPDISYEIGYPGKSAEEFINSGVDFLAKNTWVNAAKIGIQGQSWGGYQVAHLITVNNKYAAAWSGAPVVNMFSAYGGIRWQSGMNRQFQYEKTQSRIGATIWEKPELYVENSPLFKMPNVQTPVVIMANDGDGAVPWYQGIEMFTALRRLGKPVWMLNYNGEEHNLIKRENRKDISIREQQFFDHYLKDAPAPVWMIKGVPATEKGKNWGFELVK